jgi:hypothetical protein
MKRTLLSAPDGLALLPSLALLAPRGSLNRLEQLTSSFYARFEKVTALSEEAAAVEDIDRDVARRLAAEQAMLQQVLDWLKLKTKG